MNYKSFLTDTWTKFSQLFNKFVKKTFVGTRAEWDLLSAAEKKQYDLADFTDDTASGVPIISDVVTAGDMNPVTSNAVYDKLQALGQRYQIENMSFTVASGGFLDIITSLTYTTDDDTLVIPRWLGDDGLMLINTWNNNSKVCLTLKNITGQSITVQNVNMYFALVHIIGNGSWEPITASY